MISILSIIFISQYIYIYIQYTCFQPPSPRSQCPRCHPSAVRAGVAGAEAGRVAGDIRSAIWCFWRFFEVISSSFWFTYVTIYIYIYIYIYMYSKYIYIYRDLKNGWFWWIWSISLLFAHAYSHHSHHLGACSPLWALGTPPFWLGAGAHMGALNIRGMGLVAMDIETRIK